MIRKSENLLKKKISQSLIFLSDKKLQEDNEKYCGFFYFLLDKRKDDTSEILKKIISKYRDTSSAYEYLGRIASEVYPNIMEEHISLSFFWNSVKLNENNSDAWYGIYSKSRDFKAFMKSLRLDFNDNKFDSVKRKLKNFDFYQVGVNWCSKKDCREIVDIIFDENICCEKDCKRILISAYYTLERYDCGVKLIDDIDNVFIESIESYYNKNLISLDTAISKVYDFNIDKLLKNDHKKIYKVISGNREKYKSTKNALIIRAFRASEFNDVIQFYNELPDDRFSINSLDSKLYFLISKLYLNQNIDSKILGFFKSYTGSSSKELDGLLKAFEFKYNLYKLNEKLRDNINSTYPINNMSEYNQVKTISEDVDFLNHYLYDSFMSEFDLLLDEWERSYFKNRLNNLLSTNKDLNLSHDDFIELCNLWIRNNNYDEVIEKINLYHKKYPASISTYHLLGVCFQRKEMFSEAFLEYEKSIDLMFKFKNNDYIILNDYIVCARKVPVCFSTERFEELRGKLNESLVEEFKWNTFTAENFNKLFKYSPFNINTLDSLINQYFYLPSKEQLNDPIELPKIDNIGTEHLIDSNYRICSFSNNKNSMLMWSHYTDNHQGIMVEYFFGGELPSGFGIDKVKYTNGSKRNREQDKYIFNQFLLTKNDEWSYEEEVRLLSYKRDKVYYEKYDYPNHDRKKINCHVLSVTLGCNFNESKKPLVINLIKKINETRGDYDDKIKLRQSVESKNNMFGLEYVYIDI
jgi:hypothetical protein